jgi:hypothetical protein
MYTSLTFYAGMAEGVLLGLILALLVVSLAKRDS